MNSVETVTMYEGPQSRTGTYVIFLVLFVGLSTGNFIWGNFLDADDSQRKIIAGELQVLSQQIAKNASEAVRGDAQAFEGLASSRERFDKQIETLANGNTRLGLPEAPPDVKSQINRRVLKIWEQVNKDAVFIQEKRRAILDFYKVTDELAELIPRTQSLNERIVDILLDKSAAQEQVWLATRQLWYSERIIGGIGKVLQGGDKAPQAAEFFGQDVELFGQVLKGMLEGDPVMDITKVENSEARQFLEESIQLFEKIRVNVDYIIKNSNDLFSAQQSSTSIFKQTTALLGSLETLPSVINSYRDVEKRWQGHFYVSAGLFAVAIIFIFLLYLSQRRIEKVRIVESRELASKEKEQNERNQQAIIRLLDEMEGLADGDLTSNATVTEDFTGAIADAMNYTIDQLRSLVSTINDTVTRVSAATEETQTTAVELAQASKNQAQEITGASAAINEMAVSIEQVSANAAESTQVAEKSVGIAKNGAQVVRNTIEGMDTIREQIQETSKRIKRLGESSQEIGDIVALINDISDQTNILALNAAIQAAMAGESGRGFAVVADEVQRLAERSGNATKQIEALVKTIQTDTNEAVISMEQTTSEVVRGAHLAQDAGSALEDIENVSKDLADLIQNISNAARQQAASAGHVSNTMNVIQEITSQTSEGTHATATSIGKLAQLAEELKASVAGFKLPM